MRRTLPLSATSLGTPNGAVGGADVIGLEGGLPQDDRRMTIPSAVRLARPT